MIRPNIDVRGVRMRLAAGLISLALGVALAAWMMRATVSVWWILVLLVLFLGAGLGIFQARFRTCTAFAARGVCDLGRGIEKVQDPDALRAMKDQARRVWRSSWLFAFGMTLLFLVIKLIAF